MAGYNFDTNSLPEYQKTSSYLPVGKYNVVVDDAENRVGKDSGVDYLHLSLRVEGGEYDGRVCFDNLFLFSDKPDTQTRYLSYLKLLLQSLGATRMQSPQDIIGGRIAIVVRPDRQSQDKDATRVQSYEPYDRTQYSMAPSQPQAPAQPQYAAPTQQYAPPAMPQAPQQRSARPWDVK